MITEVFNKVRHKVKQMMPGSDKTKPNESYSQCGEDLIIDYIFKLRGVTQPSYIDIGANDPYFLSNTAIFYLRGCRGINIEANPQLVEKFRKYRPEDTNLNVGITSEPGEFDFFVMADNTLSTFSESECQYLVSQGHILKEKTKVSTLTIDMVLNKYCNGKFPDFLTIDVEGIDLQILQSIDFAREAPKVICVEAADYSPIGAGKRRVDIIDFLVSKGYYEYANTNLNAIMVKSDFWYI